MKKQTVTRRTFLQQTLAASAAAAIGPALSISGQETSYDAKGLPTRILGRTGVRVPIMVIGTGSRFMAVDSEDEAAEILTYALDHGLYHWDTASSYGRPEIASEERLGKILKHRRSEVFLSTKVQERDGDSAKRTIEQSLRRLQTDYIDLYQMHSITSVEEVDRLGDDSAVLPVLRDYQDQGLIRFIGFTGHTSAAAMKRAAERYDLDTMLIALNHQENGNEPFEEDAMPAAVRKGMGVLAMKVVRPRESVEGLDPKELIRYALSLANVTAAVIGTDSLDVLKANLETVRAFEPMTETEMQQIRLSLAPFYRDPNLPWLRPEYRDGFYA